MTTLALDEINIVEGSNFFPDPGEIGCVVLVVKNPKGNNDQECGITFTNRRPNNQEIFNAWTSVGQPLAASANYSIVRMRLWQDGWYTKGQRPDGWRPTVQES